MEDKALVRYYKTAQQKAEIVAQYQASGLAPRQFADQQGMCYGTLLRWVRHQQSQAQATATRLIEVPNLLGTCSAAPSYRLHFARGLMLEISRGFEPAELRSLAQVLQSL